MKQELRKGYSGPRTPAKPTPAALASANALAKFKAGVATAIQAAMAAAVVKADDGWTRTSIHHRMKVG